MLRVVEVELLWKDYLVDVQVIYVIGSFTAEGIHVQQQTLSRNLNVMNDSYSGLCRMVP